MSQAKLSERLRMMYIEARSKNPGGIEGFDTPLFFEAIAQAEAQEAQAGGVSDEKAKNIAIDFQERYHSGGSLSEHDALQNMIFQALSYARDHGYLRPSQAIGEPVSPAPVCMGCFSQEAVCRQPGLCVSGRPKWTPSGVSHEARDKAIEALETVIELWRDELINEGYDTSTNFDKATAALSALRK